MPRHRRRATRSKKASAPACKAEQPKQPTTGPIAQKKEEDQSTQEVESIKSEDLQDRSAHEVESTKSTECGSDNSEEERGDEESLWILDWDDTLFPTHWVTQEGLLQDRTRLGDEEHLKAALRAVAASAAALLEAVRRLGKVVIITNAETGWIDLCCVWFMPELAPSLKNVRVVSARSDFEPEGVQDPTEWKRRAFEREIRAFCEERVGAGEDLQVLSFGDSAHERRALFYAAREVPLFRPKSVKLLERPAPSQLVKEHAVLLQSLGGLLELQGEFDQEIQLVGTEAP